MGSLQGLAYEKTPDDQRISRETAALQRLLLKPESNFPIVRTLRDQRELRTVRQNPAGNANRKRKTKPMKKLLLLGDTGKIRGTFRKELSWKI